MLDAVNPWGRRVRPYLSPNVRAQIAREAWQVQAHFRLRQQIFAGEQGLFSASDRDENDARALPIVALSSAFGIDDEVVGVVRIYPESDGIWYGGRLGVCARYRTQGSVGTALIDCAVRSAHALGCRTFLATVQQQNVRYFERHHFAPLREIDVHGHVHCLMQADLARYPADPAALCFARAA